VLHALRIRLTPGAGLAARSETAPSTSVLAWVEDELAVLVACVTQVERPPALNTGPAAALAESLLAPMMVGGFWSELERCGRAVHMAALRDHDATAELIGCWIVGLTTGYRGDLDAARATLEHALTLAGKLGDQIRHARVQLAYGTVLGRLGHYGLARPMLDAAFTTFSKHGLDYAAASALNYLGEQLLRAGKVDQAIAQLEHALRTTSPSNSVSEAWSWLTTNERATPTRERSTNSDDLSSRQATPTPEEPAWQTRPRHFTSSATARPDTRRWKSSKPTCRNPDARSAVEIWRLTPLCIGRNSIHQSLCPGLFWRLSCNAIRKRTSDHCRGCVLQWLTEACRCPSRGRR
jgi:hypothetical protein